MKKRIISLLKIILDITMLILFILLMAYHLLPDATHEWIGASLFVIFILHNIMNYRWYKNLFKGKYKALRIMQTVINFSLIIAMLCCVISTMLISGHVFTFMHSNSVRLGRSMHLASTMWAFILMSLHFGLHWSMIVGRIKKRISIPELARRSIKYIFWILVIGICIYGIYIISIRKIWEELFLLTEFKWFDYDKPVLFYLFENSIIFILFSSISYYLKKVILSLKKIK